MEIGGELDKGVLLFCIIILLILGALAFIFKRVLTGWSFWAKTNKGACCPFCKNNNTVVIKADVYSSQKWDYYESSAKLGKLKTLHTWQCNNCGKLFQL
jgi:hypothetical protein